MYLSIFDIFKIGIGPSSSHTMGPMVAAARFLELMRTSAEPIPGAGPVAHLSCRLHGSLAFTGRGHATDRAVTLGLAGFLPDTFDAGRAETTLAEIGASGEITPPGLGTLGFAPERDLVFDYGPALPGHANALTLSASDAEGNLALEQTYYSVGGGFVQSAREMEAGKAASAGPAMP